MNQGIRLDNLNHKRNYRYFPSFTGRIPKSASQTISETAMKMYSSAITAMGMAGIALNKDDTPKEISGDEFLETLKTREIPVRNINDIKNVCVDKEGNIALETVDKVLKIIDLTDENEWRDIASSLSVCIENNSKISQLALDNYIDYLRMGLSSSEIYGLIIECSNDADDTFSKEAFEFSKRYLEEGMDVQAVEYTLAYAKNNDGYIKKEVFEPLLDLVENVRKSPKNKSMDFSLPLLRSVQNKDEDDTAQILRIVNKIVESGATPQTSLNYLKEFQDQEDFLEDIVDYSIKTKTPMYKLKRHSFHRKQDVHKLLYSTLIERNTPFFILQLMIEDIPVWANFDSLLLGFSEFLKNKPDFPPELLRPITTLMFEEAFDSDHSEEQEFECADKAYDSLCQQYNMTEDDIKTITNLRNRILATPELYVNGVYSDENELIRDVYGFFLNQYASLVECTKIFDKETIDTLLRRRLDNAEEYLEVLSLLKPEKKAILKEMVQCSNADGTPFTPIQKLEFINLLYAYGRSKLPIDRIQEMVVGKKLDLEVLEFDLLKKIFSLYDITEKDLEQVPKEKLQAWDFKYIHCLAREMEESEDIEFLDVIKASMFADFDKFIHDINNDYGVINLKTKKMFAKLGLDYEKWVKPNKDLEVQFKAGSSNAQELEIMASNTEEDIATLLENPALKNLINRRFSKCIQEGEFKIPQEIYSSKTKFEDFLKNLNYQLEDVWKRAESNKGKNPKASATLMIKDHIDERLANISNLKDNKTNKSLDWTIKMWDRVPQKDLFQGNYSTCCIGISKIYGEFMPTYLVNTIFNMIELVDNNTGKTLGNALCYFIKDKQGKPAFVIDNVEINNAVSLSRENSIKLRNSIVEYVSRLTEDISGKNDIQIYLGANYNDINCDDLVKKQVKMSLLGKVSKFLVYLDMFHSGDASVITQDEFTRYNNAYILK